MEVNKQHRRASTGKAGERGIKKSIQTFLEGEGREKRVSISDTGAHRPGGRGKRGVEREGSTMKN